MTLCSYLCETTYWHDHEVDHADHAKIKVAMSYNDCTFLFPALLCLGKNIEKMWNDIYTAIAEVTLFCSFYINSVIKGTISENKAVTIFCSLLPLRRNLLCCPSE